MSLETLYASGGNDIRIPCISFRCAAWTETVHLCQGWEDISATLETGEVVTFEAADWVGQLAKRDNAGVQGVQLVIDSRSGDALLKIDLAVDQAERIYVDYREYLDSDLSAPARPVETMTAVAYSLDEPNLSFTASFHDLVNKKWPKRRYTQSKFPGLKYYG